MVASESGPELWVVGLGMAASPVSWRVQVVESEMRGNRLFGLSRGAIVMQPILHTLRE